MKHAMDPPARRKVLRPTPVPRGTISSPAPRSLIVILRIPRQPAADSHPTSSSHQPRSLRDLVAQNTEFQSVDGTNHIASSLPTGNSSTDTSPEGLHKRPDFSSPQSISSVSTVPECPVVVPRQILLENRRKAAAVETVGIFYKWGREEIIQELNEAIQLNSNTMSGVEIELATKKTWIRESLRSRYNVYIQVYSKHIAEEHRALRGVTTPASMLGSECEYPSCGNKFSSGEYRVSFEPPGWSIPTVKKIPTQNAIDMTADLDSEVDAKPITPKPIVDPAVMLPDYKKLLTPHAIDEHGRGEFYCVKCFEKLLECDDIDVPITARAGKRKRVTEKWIRPNPLCRIYSSVFAEVRVSPGDKFGLDYDAYEIVRKWKDTVFDEKTKVLMRKFGGLIFKNGGQEVKLEAKIEDEGLAQVRVDGGRGLAECLAALRGKDTKVSRGRKKAKY